MTVSDLTETESPARVLRFRDVPWRWSDVAIGFAPIVLAFLVGPRISGMLPRWLWIPLTFLQLAWMFAFPFWVARRRGGIPPLPRVRDMLIEASITVIAAPLFIVVASVFATLVTTFLIRGESFDPFEGIVRSEKRYHGIALVFLAVAVAPFGEEFLFRGLLYNFLRQRVHFLIAALISGVVFSVFHPFGLVEQVTIATLGVLMALLYEWRKRLLSPILLHAMVNAMAMSWMFYSAAIAANAPILGVRGNPHEKGCLITEVVPGGAAAEAGIRVGDVITGAGENSVRSLGDLVLIMRMKKVGDRIPVWFIRDGKENQVEATLKPRPK